MKYKLYLDVPKGFCLAPRTVLLAWGYTKILFDIILMPFLVVSLLDMIYTIMSLLSNVMSSGMYTGVVNKMPQFITAGSLTAHVVADIVFHAILLAGQYKKSVQRLRSFCEYTKALWLITPIFGIVCILNVSGLIANRPDLRDIITGYICNMIVSTILQSLIMLLVVNQINMMTNKTRTDEENGVINGKKKYTSSKLRFTIETLKAEKVTESDDDITEQVTDTTCEEAKLTA